MNVTDIDLTDPELYVGPDAGFAVWEPLREQAPIHWNQTPGGRGYWALTRHRDAVGVYHDARSWTSERGMQVAQEEWASRAAGGRMLIVCDPPRHRALRKVLAPAFTHAAVRHLEPEMHSIVSDALAVAFEQDEIDFVTEVAAKLPMSVICALLGVPRPDWEVMVEWTRTAFGSQTGVDADAEPVSDLAKAEANANIFAYYHDLMVSRRRDGATADDLISTLIRGQIEGRPLTDNEILLNVQGLITGGNETTRHSSAGAVIAFVEHPGELERLRADRSLIPTAVEEILRWTAPSIHVMRTALRDVMVGDQLVRCGERVTIWNPAVNRDPEAFADPQRFDVGRKPNPHLTFGVGHHFCIGSTLARLELRVLLEELLDNVSSMEITGPVKRLRSATMWGVDRVPVRLRAADRAPAAREVVHA